MHWGHRSGNKSQRLLLEELEQLVLWLGSQWQQSSEEAASLAQDWELAQSSSSSSKLSNKSLTKTIGIVDYSSEQQKKPLPRKTMQKKQSVLISIWRGTAGTFSQQSHAMQLIFQTNFPEELSSKSLSSSPPSRTFQKRFLEKQRILWILLVSQYALLSYAYIVQNLCPNSFLLLSLYF